MAPRPCKPVHEHVRLTDSREGVARLAESVLAAVDQCGYPKAAQFAIRLALEEAVVNAFKHGHKALPEGTPVDVDFEVNADLVRIAVQDQGPGFDPHKVPDPTLDENLEVPSGRGLMLIKAYMSDVRHNPQGNRVEMTFRPTPRGKKR